MQQNWPVVCACDQLRYEGEKSVLLHQTPRPGHNRQRDFILLQLEHGDERRVVHAHCGGAVHCHYLVTAPGEIKHKSLTLSPVSARDDGIQETIASYRCQISLNLLEASVKVRRCSRHNGFNEEGLLAVTLLIAPYDAEAPAFIVGFLQDNVTAPVQLTARTRAESELQLSCKGTELRRTEGGSTSAIPATESTVASS